MESSLPLHKRWWIFIKERFEPVSTLTMIVLFLAAHFAATGSNDFLRGIPLLVGTTFFFFKLRLYDEIKDYETDIEINPTRPMPRGLLKHKHLYRMIGACIFFELIAFSLVGIGSLISITAAILYSLFMYKEFFIGKYIRPHLTTYAMSHTVVTVLLGTSIISGVKGVSPWELTGSDFWFVLNNWFMFNIFEFGRKTYLSSEERENVESYSKIFSRFGAVGLVLMQALLSTYCIWQMEISNFAMKTFIVVTIAIIALIGSIYALYNKGIWGKVYRAYSSGHIVVFYIGFIACALLG